MAKKLTWGSFSTDDLVIDEQDDIYLLFPFLAFVGMLMVKKNEFRITLNAVRGIKDTVSQKLVGLAGSLFYGWDRTSWPVPFLTVKGEKETFDRRHTVKVCLNNNSVDEIPGAEYRRVRPENGGIFNDFLDKSIITMAAMWGNVFGPIVEDTKDYMFETACVHIIREELEREDIEHEEDLLTRSFVRKLLKYMGCYTRYNDNTTVTERIVTKVLDSLRDPEAVVGQLTINNNEEDVDAFVNSSDEWKGHNQSDDNYYYMMIPIKDHAGWTYTYADRLLRVACEQENSTGKTVKALLHNKENSNNAKKIVTSRIKFKKSILDSWRVRRDNVLAPIEKVLNPDIIERKKLNDLKLEVWFMNQLDDEDEPFEVSFEDD